MRVFPCAIVLTLLAPVALSVGACSNVIGLDHLAKVDCAEPCNALKSADSSPTGTGDDASGDGGGGPDAARDSTGPIVTPADATADAATDASPPDSAPPDAARPDAATDAGTDASVACPGTGGPVAQRVGSFCIDRTEVTNRQYAAFLTAKGSDVSGQPAVCSFNTSYVPSSAWPATTAKLDDPVVYVDWCDGAAFCAWAGKRLCGAIAGGSSTFGSVGNPSTNQWYYACSNGGARTFPYGNSYVANNCNDFESRIRTTSPAGSLAGCSGGFPGLADMNGNVYEWEDGCETALGPDDSCLIRGGSWRFSGAQYSACASYFADYKVKRSDKYDDMGFRCCSR